MDKKTAHQIVNSAHRAARTIVRARDDLSAADQDEMYSRIYLGLLEDILGTMTIQDLLDVLAGS
jgi:hypothetical protein